MADYKALITLDLDGNAAAGVHGILDQVSSLGKVLSNLPGIAAAAVGLNELANGAKKVYEAGIQMNAMLETSALGMASLYVSMGEIYDQTGRNVKGMEAFNGALQIAKETQQRLVEVSIASAGDAKEVINMYERMYAGMASAGTKSKDVQSQMVKFTATIANMAGTLQWPFETVAQQMNNMLLGIGRTQSRVGGLLKSLGVTKEMMDGWRAHGVLLDELQEKLNAFWEKGPLLEKTWQATFSNMTTAFGLFAAELTRPVFDTFREYMNNAMDSFMTRTKDGGRALNEDIAQNLRVMGTTVDAVVKIIGTGFLGGIGIINNAMQKAGIKWVEVFSILGQAAVDVANKIAVVFATLGQVLSNPKGSIMAAFDALDFTVFEFLSEHSPTEGMAKYWRGLADDILQSSHSLVDFASNVDKAMVPVEAITKKAKGLLELLGKNPPGEKGGGFSSRLNSLKALFGNKDAEKAARELAQAAKAYDDLILKLQQKDELAGLDGIAKKFVQVRITAENEMKALKEAAERYSKALGAPNGGRQDTSWMAGAFLINEAQAKENDKILNELLGDWEEALKKGSKVTEEQVHVVKGHLSELGQYFHDTIGSMSRAVDDGLFGAITQGMGGLVSAMQRYNDDILHDFTGLVAAMVKKWLEGIRTMQLTRGQTTGGLPRYDENGAPTQTGWYDSPGVGTYAGAGVAALGAAGSYATGGSQSFWSGMAPYTSVASIAASLGPATYGIGYIVAAVAVLVGLVANALAPDTEDHSFVKSAYLFDGSGRPTSGAGAQVLETAHGISATLTDLFRLTGQEGTADFAKSLNKIILDYIKTIDFEAHAGSSEDLQKDLERIFTTEIPKNLLNLMFGRLLSPQDLPGISGGSKGDGSFDENAPIPKMLKTLGFSAKAIQEIADQIDLRGPEKFLEYFKSLVGLVVNLNHLIADIGRSGTKVLEDQANEEAMSPVARFKKGIASLKEDFAALDAYTGDAYIKKAQELVENARQYYAEALKFIDTVRGLIKSITDSINAQIKSMDAAFMSSAERRAELYDTINKSRGDLTGDDPNKIAGAVQTIQNAVAELFNGLIQIYNNAKAALAEIRDTQALFAGGLEGEGANTPMSIAERAKKLWGDVAKAAALSGQDQVDAIRAVNTEARNLFEAMTAAIREITSNIENLTKSIWQQKFGMLMDASTPQEQVDLILGRVRDLQGKLRNASSAAEVKEITDEIQDLMRQYWGLVKDDPKAKGAGRELINKILDETEALAKYVYGGLKDTITKALDPIRSALEAAAGVVTSAMDDVKKEVDALKLILEGVRDTATGSLTTIVNAVVDAFKDLKPELDALHDNLTTLNTDIGGPNDPRDPRDPDRPPHGPDSLIAAYERSKNTVDAFTAALGNAVLALGGQIPATSNAVTGPTDAAARQAVIAIRRDPSLTKRITGGFA